MAKKKLTPAAFAAKVLSYRGTPFVLGARIPGVGLDCCGVPLCALYELGWRPEHPDAVAQLNYPQVTEDDSLLQVLQGECVRIQPTQMQLGDIPTFCWQGKEFPQHLGVMARVRQNNSGYSDPKRILEEMAWPFVHAWNDPNIVPPRVVENTLRGEWLDRFHSAWRLRCFT